MSKIVRIVSTFFVLLLSTATFASAESFDLSTLSYDELVALKEQIDIAIWNSQEWQEVTVPQGVWVVGEDIPAGHWTIRGTSSYITQITIGTVLNAAGDDISWASDFYFYEGVKAKDAWGFDPNTDREYIDFELKEGMYVIIDSASAIFTPYTGKPSLGFK